ncbi:hypothetical protein [Clostridium saccharoperbutylacetonicum]|uniref:hypothetical protein n=1 Tax=Clostridium saccharoperbutylacetonicum TaxID=36745 RepID=UPI0039E9D923
MSKENLIYNCSGVEYWEKLYNEKYEKLCLYEGHHGRYVGEIIDDCVYNSKTGKYLGEIYNGRLIVDKSKVGKDKIEGNLMFRGSNRMGHACIAKASKINMPKGYEDFIVGIE